MQDFYNDRYTKERPVVRARRSSHISAEGQILFYREKRESSTRIKRPILFEKARCSSYIFRKLKAG